MSERPEEKPPKQQRPKEGKKKRHRLKASRFPKECAAVRRANEYILAEMENIEREAKRSKILELGEPTDAPPGSERKILVLQERVAKGLALWHPKDATWNDRLGSKEFKEATPPYFIRQIFRMDDEEEEDD